MWAEGTRKFSEARSLLNGTRSVSLPSGRGDLGVADQPRWRFRFPFASAGPLEGTYMLHNDPGQPLHLLVCRALCRPSPSPRGAQSVIVLTPSVGRLLVSLLRPRSTLKHLEHPRARLHPSTPSGTQQHPERHFALLR
eukprot:scaffold120123_cov69-Phaeocystis_antarctica.AAC.4